MNKLPEFDENPFGEPIIDNPFAVSPSIFSLFTSEFVKIAVTL